MKRGEVLSSELNPALEEKKGAWLGGKKSGVGGWAYEELLCPKGLAKEVQQIVLTRAAKLEIESGCMWKISKTRAGAAQGLTILKPHSSQEGAAWPL